MNIEVLVACMQQKDCLGLYNIMNLKTDAIFANQCGRYEYEELCNCENLKKIRIISSTARGVGKNRNTALLYANGDILLLADEDIIYKDDYVENVERAFDCNPTADMIIFDLNYLNNFMGKKRKIKQSRRIYWYNSMRYGGPRIAIKKQSIEKANIWFSVLYGGGAPFSSGEDSLFIREALKKGLKIYTYPYIIADVKQEESSWFDGFTEKYYFDKGFWLANAFPLMKYIFSFYYAWRFRCISKDLGFIKILKLIFNGISAYKK